MTSKWQFKNFNEKNLNYSSVTLFIIEGVDRRMFSEHCNILFVLSILNHSRYLSSLKMELLSCQNPKTSPILALLCSCYTLSYFLPPQARFLEAPPISCPGCSRPKTVCIFWTKTSWRECGRIFGKLGKFRNFQNL